MDVKTRADLVRAMRIELKKLYMGGTAYSQANARAADRPRPRQPNVNPRQRENYSSFMRRRMDASAGDGDIYDAAARWDRHRARMPKPLRRRTRRAERDPGGYVGYEGDWAGHFGYSTPGRGPRRAKR